MKYVILGLTLILIGCMSTQSKSNKYSDRLYILFGGCFYSDTVTLQINNVQIFSDEVFVTDSLMGTGEVPMSEVNYSSGIFRFKENVIHSTLKNDDILNLRIIKNRTEYSFEYKLRKGRYFIVSSCTQNRNGIKTNQYKEMPVLD